MSVVYDNSKQHTERIIKSPKDHELVQNENLKMGFDVGNKI